MAEHILASSLRAMGMSDVLVISRYFRVRKEIPEDTDAGQNPMHTTKLCLDPIPFAHPGLSEVLTVIVTTVSESWVK
jgi:hypothetical protein